jgi:hypothetical protein
MFLCLVISRMELIRKDKEKFRSARKIPEKRPLIARVLLFSNNLTSVSTISVAESNSGIFFPYWAHKGQPRTHGSLCAGRENPGCEVA